MLPHAPHERPGPRIVVMGASAGGIRALTTILASLPAEFPAPIVIVQHRAIRGHSNLVPILARITRLAVIEASEGDTLRAGTVYIARADEHLTVTPSHCFVYVDGHPIHHIPSSANPLFESSANSYGAGAVAVVLTGAGSDGTDGVQAIKARGGTVIAQDPATSEHVGMPLSAIESGAVDLVLPVEAIGPALVRLIVGTPADVASDEKART